MSANKVASREIEASILYAIFKYTEISVDKTVQNPVLRMCVFDYLSTKISTKEFSFEENRLLFEEISNYYAVSNVVPSFKALISIIESSETGASDETKRKIIKLNSAYEEVRTHPIKREEVDIFVKRFKTLYAMRCFYKEAHETVSKIGEVGFEVSLSSFINSLSTIESQFKETSKEDLDLDLIGSQKKVEEALKKIETVGGVWYGIPTIDIDWADRCPKLQPGDLVIFQAKTGVGKSMMLMSAAFDNASKIDRRGNQKQTKKVLIVTIEMNAYQYYYRLASRMTEIEHHFFTTGKVINEEAMMQKWERSKQTHFNIGEDIRISWRPMCSPMSIEKAIKACPYEPELLIVDYAADMIFDKDDKSCKNMTKSSAEGQGYLYESLKKIAGKYNLVCMTAQQLNRKVSAKNAAEFGSGYGSSRPEQLSDAGIMLVEMDDDIMERDPGSETARQLSLVMGKMRGTGFKGRKIKIKPRFSHMTWDDLGSPDQVASESSAPPKSEDISENKKEATDEVLEVPDLESFI